MYKLLFKILALGAIAGCSHGKFEYRNKNGIIGDVSDYINPVDTGYLNPTEEQKAEEQANTDRRMAEAIEQRISDSIKNTFKAVYLINTSTSNKYSFTIKISDDEIPANILTKIFKLNPGEQQLIEDDNYIGNKGKIIKQKFEIVGEIAEK